jgi:hypothetical protein
VLPGKLSKYKSLAACSLGTLQPIIMRTFLTSILLGISLFCLAQTEKKADKKTIDGIILCRFIPDLSFENYYCSLIPKILIDSMTYDFVPHNGSNFSIISKYKQFEESLGTASTFNTENLETNLCVYRSNNKRLKSCYCDSAINVYRNNNLYDTLLYKPDLQEHMTLRINSDAIYTNNGSDTTYIVLQFNGSIIKYVNVEFGEKSDYFISAIGDRKSALDEYNGFCPFEKHNTTFIVLNKVKRLNKVDEVQITKLGLKKSELTELKLFLYE